MQDCTSSKLPRVLPPLLVPERYGHGRTIVRDEEFGCLQVAHAGKVQRGPAELGNPRG